MKKTFIHTLPDEPYKTTARLNKTVQCEYSGPRYHVVRVQEKDGIVLNVERSGEDREALEATIVDDGPIYDFFILDSETHPWEAAYLTHAYSHGEVQDYEETLPNGHKYLYQLLDGHGIIEQFHAVNTMKYDKGSNLFVRPPFVTHPITKSEFWEGIDNQIKELIKMLERSGQYSSKQIADIEAYKAGLESIKSNLSGVDHWKIPFPIYPDLS
jgi:hypothetical protein